MNIWALPKDQSIKHFLLLLETRLGSSAYCIDTDIRLNDRAVYLVHRDMDEVRAYVYTLGQLEGYYGVHLEYPGADSSAPLYDSFENVGFDKLVDMLAGHFDVPVICPLP